MYSTPLDPATTAAAASSHGANSPFASAQFGGNILTVQDGVVFIQKASGKREKSPPVTDLTCASRLHTGWSVWWWTIFC